MKNQSIHLQMLSFLQEIPKWKVSTYKLIGEKFWVHPRSVAFVLKHNKDIVKYPCYKVIANDWKISWYNWVGWVQEKIEKLQNDWVEITDGRIDKRFFYI